MNVSTRNGAVESVADVFEADDLGAPFKVYLHDAVVLNSCPDTDEILSYTIPALPQLQAMIVVKRVSNPRKLSGSEMKFIRKILGLKQSDFANKLDLSVEHLSRCENGLPLSPQNEKLFRGVTLSVLAKVSQLSDRAKQTEIQAALFSLFDDMKLVSVSDVDDPLVMNFSYCKVSDEDLDEENSDWFLDAA